MSSRDETARKLQQELDKQRALRHDEKAWKKQMDAVNKAADAHSKTLKRGNR